MTNLSSKLSFRWTPGHRFLTLNIVTHQLITFFNNQLRVFYRNIMDSEFKN